MNNYFPAQSLHFRYGSAAPCPTLRAYVTSSPPRTRYGRTATPYPTGFPCCDIISLQRPLAQSVENSLRCFHSSHAHSIITEDIRAVNMLSAIQKQKTSFTQGSRNDQEADQSAEDQQKAAPRGMLLICIRYIRRTSAEGYLSR